MTLSELLSFSFPYLPGLLQGSNGGGENHVCCCSSCFLEGRWNNKCSPLNIKEWHILLLGIYFSHSSSLYIILGDHQRLYWIIITWCKGESNTSSYLGSGERHLILLLWPPPRYQLFLPSISWASLWFHSQPPLPFLPIHSLPASDRNLVTFVRSFVLFPQRGLLDIDYQNGNEWFIHCENGKQMTRKQQQKCMC